MPNLKASIKDVRQVKKRRARNVANKDAMKQLVKEFTQTVVTDKKKATALLPQLYKAIDKNAKRNLLHKNTAARKKASLAKMVK